MEAGRLINEIVARSVPFVDILELNPLLERLKDRRLVLLGSASHGTREFTEWRSRITAELIERHGFNFVAIEGDWPACQEVNRFIQGKNQLGSVDTLRSFTRWPTWPWANAEMVSLIEWLKQINTNREKLVGIHGLDLYSLFESIEDCVREVNDVDQRLARQIKKLYSCFAPFWQSERAYVREVLRTGISRDREVHLAFDLIQNRVLRKEEGLGEALQNARIVKNAERYYQSMLDAPHDSWNVRDLHMLETIESLLDHYGPRSKGIVWAHNTHVGDHRATEMRTQQLLSLGGLTRMKLGRAQVALIGFTTYRGTVLASRAWEGKPEVLELSKAKPRSLEHILHEAIPRVGGGDNYLLFDRLEPGNALKDYRGQRSIGVVYQTDHERRSQYISSAVGERYDGLVFINDTSALTPLQISVDRHKMPETYPFGHLI